MGGGGPPGGVLHTLPSASSSVCGTHPLAFVSPHFHQGGCTRGGHPCFDRQGCRGACSSSVSRLLQPPVCGLEDLGVVETGHRPVSSQPLRGRFALPRGDHPVCSSVGPSGGLDSLHRPSGSVSSGSCPSGFSSLPPLCGAWLRVPVQSDVFWSLHGPSGLHSGYGSCLGNSSFLGYPYASLPGRLARPGLLSRGAPPGSRGCPVPLSRARDSCQPEEVQLLPVSGGSVSQGGHRRAVFYVFSVARSRLQAQVNSRRISVLRRASRQLVAVAAGMLSSLSHLVPGGCLRMWSLQICLHRSWDWVDPSARVAWSLDCGGLSGGFTEIASLAGCLSVRCPRIWTFGPTLSTSVGVLTWVTKLLPAFGPGRRRFFPSMPGSCWQCVTVSSTSSPFCPGPLWRCFATTSPRSPICKRKGAPGLLLSTPSLRRFCVGLNFCGFA